MFCLLLFLCLIKEEETILHVLVSCSFAHRCWEAFGMEFVLGHSVTFFDWLCLCFSKFSIDGCSHLLSICWSIWFYRNKKVWDSIVVNPSWIVKYATDFLENWSLAQLSTRRLKRCIVEVVSWWTPPMENFLKVNVDIAINVRGAHTSVGLIARNHLGQFVV